MSEEIEEMRRQVMAHDNAMARERGLSSVMMAALGSMPVALQTAADGHKWLPHFGPSGNTIAALERRGLIACDGQRWDRTPLGESVWANR